MMTTPKKVLLALGVGALLGPVVLLFIWGPLFAVVCGAWTAPFHHDALVWCMDRSAYSWLTR
jgi:hypothetical protein